MSDVNDNAEATEVAQVEPETTAPESHQGNETAEVQSEAQKPIERTIPYSRFAEVNKGYKEAQRKLAEYEQKSKLSQYSEDDVNAVLAHPYTQELAIKVAKYELTDFARGLMDQHPEVPEPVKKAILQNVRGFVKETTTDVDSAKIDIQEYIESLVEQLPAQQQPKVIPVASTKTQDSTSNIRPIDVQEIMDKPVDEWTDDEAKLVDQYKKTQPKRQ